jgi:benzylsuccinate CoA-transferase BbsF subunit
MVAEMYGAAALVAALDHRRRTGRGQCIDHSQIEATINFLAPLILDYSANGKLIERNGNKVDYAAPHGTYRCKGEDRWVAIAVFTEDEWDAFREVIGYPKWSREERFSTLGNRINNNEELDTLVSEWTAGFTPEQVMEMMQVKGVAAGVVSNAKDQAEDPQLKEYDYFQELDHPYLGKLGFYHPQNFVLSDAVPVLKAPVLLGEHTEYVATEIIGMSDEEFVQLVGEGVFE